MTPKTSTKFVREVAAKYTGRRAERIGINGPEGIAEFVRSVLVDNSREQFVAIYLDGSHSIIAYSVVSIGTANASQIHAREVYQMAVLSGAVSVIVSHNHPSGNVEPSAEDKKVTQNLKSAGALLGIKLLDHVIVSDEAMLSLRESDISLFN